MIHHKHTKSTQSPQNPTNNRARDPLLRRYPATDRRRPTETAAAEDVRTHARDAGNSNLIFGNIFSNKLSKPLIPCVYLIIIIIYIE